MNNSATSERFMSAFKHMLPASRLTIIKLLDENTQPRAFAFRRRRRAVGVIIKFASNADLKKVIERTGQGTPASSPGA